MDTINSLSPQSINKINTLVEKINATCDALISALEINSENVSGYNMSIVDKMNIQSEFFDLVVKNILLIKKHLGNLQKHINEDVISDIFDLQNMVSSLKETSDALNQLLINDNNFNNVYSMPIIEIQNTIEAILNEIKIGEVILI